MICVVTNMSPLITIVFAFLLLKEKVKTFEVIMIVLTIGGVVTIVTGAQADESNSEAELSTALKYAMWGALFLNPFLVAGGTIAMRKMKKFNVAVVSWYLNLGILISSIILVLALGEGFSFIAKFDWISWMLSIGTGLTAFAL